jgi:hypothetical protein
VRPGQNLFEATNSVERRAQVTRFKRIFPVILIGAALVALNVGMRTWLNPQVTRTPAQVALPEPGELLFHDDFLDAARVQADWALFSGEWTVEDGALVQHQTNGSDFGAGYRVGTFPGDYLLRVRFAHQSGVGGGVLFDMPQADGIGGAVLVRYAEQGSAIMWGSFDETGQYAGAGSMDVPPAGTDPHTLDIFCQGSRYAFRLDSQLTVTDIPLSRGCGGTIGLTASQSVVAFDLVQVFALEQP